MTRDRVFVTSAPDAYDYGYVIELSHFTIDWLQPQGNCRVVSIPPDNAEYQLGRYGSGNHWTKEITP
jgi:hypothetical protein